MHGWKISGYEERAIQHSLSPRDLRGQALNKLREAGISLLLALTTGFGAAQTTTQREIQLHYQRATEALKAKQSQEATKEFREILRIDPRNAEACANLGQIAFSEQE